jgi:hypothetical protein
MKKFIYIALTIILIGFTIVQSNAQCPTCPGGSTVITVPSSASITLASGSNYCLQGSGSYTGTLNLNGGTLFIGSGVTYNPANQNGSTASTINNCGTISRQIYPGNIIINNYSNNTTLNLSQEQNGFTLNNYATGLTLAVMGNPNNGFTINNKTDATITSLSFEKTASTTNSASIINNVGTIALAGTIQWGGTINNGDGTKAGTLNYTGSSTLWFQSAGKINNNANSVVSLDVIKFDGSGNKINMYDHSNLFFNNIGQNNVTGAINQVTGCSYVQVPNTGSSASNNSLFAQTSGTINYCGPVPYNSAAASKVISAVANNGSGAYRITFPDGTNAPSTGGYIAIYGAVGGTLNGYWQVTKISNWVYDLIGSTYSTTDITSATAKVNNLTFGSASYLGQTGCTNPCIPLPVKLISFTATKDNGNVKISWQTIEEKDNDYYVIERSTDGINFTALTTVKGNKNSTSLISYVQYDDAPYLGISYYRLKQVDMNGSFSYSSIAAVEFDSPTDWMIYPNPSKDGSFTIASGFTENEVVTVTVTDVTGNRVRYYDNSLYAQEMQVSNLSSGLYIVSIQTVTQLLSKKLIVE